MIQRTRNDLLSVCSNEIKIFILIINIKILRLRFNSRNNFFSYYFEYRQYFGVFKVIEKWIQAKYRSYYRCDGRIIL